MTEDEQASEPRNWDPIVPVGMEHALPPRRLWVNDQEPFITYTRWVWEFRVYLTMYCGLRTDESVMEIGCNHGRTMLSLAQYLRTPGRYEGFDIAREQVEYAQRNVGSAQCSVGFHYVDVYNEFYNPEGKLDVAVFEFPCGPDEFDVVFAASVFTHMLPPGVANYIKQTGRVLKPGGRALFSVFVLDYFRGKGTALSPVYDYVHKLDGYDDVAIIDPNRPEAFIAYSKARLEQMVADAGLELTRLVPGTWSTSHPVGVCDQDLIVLTKPG